MATTRYKVLIVEVDGTELSDQTELDFQALNMFFDKGTTSFVSDNVDAALKELLGTVQGGASPGLSWGRSGNVPNNAYLQNETVPSNITGRPCPVTGTVTTLFAAIQTAGACTFTLQKRSGTSFVDLASISLASGQRSKILNITSPPAVAFGDELAVKVTSGSPNNPIVGAIVKGATS